MSPKGGVSLSINVNYVRPMPLGGVVEIEAEVGGCVCGWEDWVGSGELWGSAVSMPLVASLRQTTHSAHPRPLPPAVAHPSLVFLSCRWSRSARRWR